LGHGSLPGVVMASPFPPTLFLPFSLSYFFPFSLLACVADLVNRFSCDQKPASPFLRKGDGLLLFPLPFLGLFFGSYFFFGSVVVLVPSLLSWFPSLMLLCPASAVRWGVGTFFAVFFPPFCHPNFGLSEGGALYFFCLFSPWT